jgi:cytidylate kinase
MNNFQIAIDGPAGAGKSTIAKIAAKKLGYIYIDTGAMYRAIGLFFDRNGAWPESHEKIKELVGRADINIGYENGEQVIFLNGENVSSLIRTQEAGDSASKVSRFPEVREKMVELQQRLAGTKNVIMDGRDIGTVVLPDAQLKIFLTADVSVRAKRRLLQLEEKGQTCDIAKIEEEIRRRDKQDMTRSVSPLKQADDAILLDTSDKTIDEVVEEIVKLQKERIG